MSASTLPDGSELLARERAARRGSSGTGGSSGSANGSSGSGSGSGSGSSGSASGGTGGSSGNSDGSANGSSGSASGSGIFADDLQGTWWLARLWSRQGQAQAASAALLAGIGACLAIAPADTAEGPGCLRIRNSVQLGPLALQFSGPGWLRGRRPLLLFRFERIALFWGQRQLWDGTLPEPPARRLPFFALIACERDGERGWLAARGRGGGLAAWELRPSAPRG